MIESGVQRIIIRNLEREGFYVLKLIQTNKNGIPDLLCFKKERDRTLFFMVEVKRTDKNELDQLQVWRQKEITRYGMTTYIANDWESLQEALMHKKII